MPPHSARHHPDKATPSAPNPVSRHKKGSSCRDTAPMQSYVDRCLKLITHAGLRVTGPRRAVVSFLAQSDHPVTIAQLHEELAECHQQTEQLSKVSLYRVIADLERIHLLHRTHPNGGYVLCAHVGCADHSHVIITCQQCDETSEATVPGEFLGPLVFFLKTTGAQLPDPPILRVEGLCARCCKSP